MSEEKTLFLVVMKGDDSDAYTIHTNLADATLTFNGALDGFIHYNVVYLIEVLPGDEIGFGSYGDLYGGDLIGHWENGELMEDPAEAE